MRPQGFSVVVGSMRHNSSQATGTESAAGSLLVGIDENGLGARLGPMIVTGVLATVTDEGKRWLKRRLPLGLARDLGDSKQLVSYGNADRGEAWARALVPEANSPDELLVRLALESTDELRAHCPQKAVSQCWDQSCGEFEADAKLMGRVKRHLALLEARGVRILDVRSSILCVGRMNRERAGGCNRFTSDLHAMERLLLTFRDRGGTDLHATCGKVGGIASYPKFFGPLAGRLHTVLQEDRMHSAYRLPGLGDVHFLQDADAGNPLVMLASMVGKYVRELSMARISRFYASQLEDVRCSSGYHDAVTSQFIEATAVLRKRRGIPQACFERE